MEEQAVMTWNSVGKGENSWPEVTREDIDERNQLEKDILLS